jgi:adenylate kinase family enzyme
VIGPSTSGKSTLAAAIGHSRGLPVVHLDQYRHRPRTAWVERPDDEFAALHGEAVRGERWVIEGNNSRRLPETAPATRAAVRTGRRR